MRNNYFVTNIIEANWIAFYYSDFLLVVTLKNCTIFAFNLLIFLIEYNLMPKFLELIYQKVWKTPLKKELDVSL